MRGRRLVVLATVLAVGLVVRSEVRARTQSVVEVRSYNLLPGTRDAFHRLVVDEAVPMLRRWETDVVAYGPSVHDETSYYVMRAYESVEHRERSQDAFYGSAEWRDGPRENILALIESYTTIVLPLGSSTVDELRGLVRPGS